MKFDTSHPSLCHDLQKQTNQRRYLPHQNIWPGSLLGEHPDIRNKRIDVRGAPCCPIRRQQETEGLSVLFLFYYISSFDSDLISIPVDPQVVRHLIDYQERRRRRWVKVQENIGDIWRSWLSLPRRIFSSMGHHGIRGLVLKVISLPSLSISIGPSFT